MARSAERQAEIKVMDKIEAAMAGIDELSEAAQQRVRAWHWAEYGPVEVTITDEISSASGGNGSKVFVSSSPGGSGGSGAKPDRSQVGGGI